MTGVDPLIGRDLDGRYTILDQVGRGNMAIVYRATQHGLGREVAIKVVTPRLGVDSVVIKRFLREAKLASRLSHPNAVAVLDFGQTADGLIYLVMELVKGRTLEDAVKAEGRLPAARVVRIGSQICDALEGAHALQIIHRDLKPANIMLMSAGRDIVKVLDFGLAKSLQPEQASMNMTSVGALLGTPAFMPPESVTGGVVDRRADLYSLGCTLYFAAMGKLPFDSPAIAEIIAMHAMEPPPPLVGVHVALARVIEKLLAKSPTERYADAIATRDALEETLSAAKDVVPGGSAASAPAPAHAPPVRKKTPREGTMLGWATPPSGVPLAKARPSDEAPTAKANDGGVVVKMRTTEAAPTATPPKGLPTRPSTAPSISTPPRGSPVARPSAAASHPIVDIPMPSPSAVVPTTRADTEVDGGVRSDTLMSAEQAAMTPMGMTPGRATPFTARADATPGPARMASAPSNAVPAAAMTPAPTSPTKTFTSKRSVSIAWIVIILVFLASGALVAYKLYERYSENVEPAPSSDPPTAPSAR